MFITACTIVFSNKTSSHGLEFGWLLLLCCREIDFEVVKAEKRKISYSHGKLLM